MYWCLKVSEYEVNIVSVIINHAVYEDEVSMRYDNVEFDNNGGEMRLEAE